MQRILFFMLIFMSIILGVLGIMNTRRIETASLEKISVTIIYGNDVQTMEVEPYTTVEEILDLLRYDDIDMRKINPQRILGHRDVLSLPKNEALELISINTATQKELLQLNGVGPKLADAIIAYREEHGSFRELSDLKRVKGMGEKKYEKIAKDICL